MKRLPGIALLLLLAMPVSAKTLIIAAEVKKANLNGYQAGERAAIAARVQILTTILDTFGASYVVIPANAMRTQWARSGVVTWDFGTSSAHTETFGAVIHANFTRKGTGTPDYAGYRPDRLTVNGADSLPLVPQLMLGGGDAAEALGTSANLYTNASYCSTGVTTYEGAGGGSGSHDEEGSYYQPLYTQALSSMSVSGHAVLSTASVANKGLSVLLAQGTNPIGAYFDEFLVFSSNWDSVGRVASPDTAKIWMVRNLHAAGKSKIIYADVSEATVGDGTEGLVTTTEIFDIPVLMIALAALDSASGGAVFDNKARLPLGVAVTIDGLCSRSSARNSGGCVPSDTSRFYASLDSLSGLAVPIAFGVNIDSAATYPRDLQYAMTNRLARFSPQSRAGLDTAVAFAPTGGITHRYRAVDTFGRYRNQSMAYGPNAGLAADTSCYAKLTYALALGDSMWGRDRTSRFALPSDDDWSPYNLRAWQADKSRGVVVDSILYAYAKAGFRGIRINAGWDVGRPNLNPNNPIGYIPDQGRYATANRSLKINLIGHNGGSTFGNQAFVAIVDSVAPGTVGSTEGTLGWYAAKRFWQGVFGYSPLMYVGSDNSENSTGEIQRCRILRVSAQELSGPATQTNYKTTQRPGWWEIRRVVMPIEIMNRIAGRSIMQVVYPENIKP